ncbi:GbsR/MarR family transcriptional regulator [Streptomyces heilongjiangensis]|uniref:GbsR/MarR family transcriptional regulator n=1 Tax=Streptomyces heilongjiangensis TaxID=945052 RepID=A0ABW1B014_9ACTN|nr:helix-turn-helix domain-containing protein [Streptomyces heilongjiangensis]MDC2946547.1 helix-turn-helix domain-containing protein [Streptomyces heilongjiangensis]
MDKKGTQLREYAERLALTLAESGMQRTTARVMTALLFTQQEAMTAADLCEELKISSGAVSSAVNQLIPTGMIERVPAPGSRRDHYRFREHAWATLMGNQNALLDSMWNAAAEGIKAAGHDSVAGRRLDEMQDFYGFMQREMAALIDKWRQRYDAGDR